MKQKAKTAYDLLPVEVRTPLPKYARVNTLLSSVDEIMNGFSKFNLDAVFYRRDQTSVPNLTP